MKKSEAILVIKDFIRDIRLHYSNYVKRENQVQANRMAQARNAHIYAFMTAMQSDIFQAMKNKCYSRLQTITDPTQIRVTDYRIKDGCYFFMFSLTKKESTDNPIDVILEKIRNNINADIKQATFNLYSSNGPNMSLYYPFLYNGLYVIRLIDNGVDIHMICTTHLQP